MKLFRSAAGMLLLSLLLFSCKKESPDAGNTIVIKPPVPLDFYLVGYFPTYRSVNDYPDRTFRMYNVINYAFLNVNSSGGIDDVNLSNYNGVYAKAKANGAKVFLSLSNAANFKQMAATAEGRKAFIEDLMNKVRQLKADGVDIDWEYPKTSDGTDATFSLLIRQLSDSLHRDGQYFLSLAITPGKYAGAIRDGIRTELFGYVDFFNVMIYDDFSTSVPYKQHADMNLWNTSFHYWVQTRGMPAKKFVGGIPGFGRPSGITQTNTVLAYKTILQKGGNAYSDSAVVSSGGFTNYTIYYNGISTVKKKAALARKTCGGIMLWEIGQDTADDFSLFKAVNDTLGRRY